MNTMEHDTQNTDATQGKWKVWLKRFGFLGFMFFLIKGLVWIGVALIAGKALFD